MPASPGYALAAVLGVFAIALAVVVIAFLSPLPPASRLQLAQVVASVSAPLLISLAGVLLASRAHQTAQEAQSQAQVAQQASDDHTGDLVALDARLATLEHALGRLAPPPAPVSPSPGPKGGA